jgi:hypothetical protein
VGTLASDVAGAIAPVETAVQPVLAIVTDTVGTLASDVAGAIAPVETAVQPVITTVTETVAAHASMAAGAVVDGVAPALAPTSDINADSISHAVTDVSNTALHVGSAGAVTPALPDLVDVSQAAAPATTGDLTDLTDHVASAAPVIDAAGPLLADTTGAASPPTMLSHPTDIGNVASHALANAAPGDTAGPALTTTAAAPSNLISDVSHPADTGNVASHVAADAAPIADTTAPVLASDGASLSHPATHALQPATPDTSTGQAPESADTLLALATASNAPLEAPASMTAAPANVATGVSNADYSAAIAGDAIALKDAPPPAADALFTGNHYTDYGVTLSTDIAVPAQHAVSPTDTASAHDTLVPVAADAHAPPMDTTHSIDHLGLRDAIL